MKPEFVSDITLFIGCGRKGSSSSTSFIAVA